MATISLQHLQGLLDAGLQSALQNAAMFDKMGASLLASVRQGIQAEKAPDGSAWAPLKPATVKKRKGRAHPILRLSNHLYQSISYQHSNEHAQVGTNMPYARIHQHGGEIQRKAGSHPMNFNYSKKTGKMRLVKAKRANFIMDVAHKAYSIPIPARPYLYTNDGTVPKTWKDPLVNIFLRTLKNTLEAK